MCACIFRNEASSRRQIRNSPTFWDPPMFREARNRKMSIYALRNPRSQMRSSHALGIQLCLGESRSWAECRAWFEVTRSGHLLSKHIVTSFCQANARVPPCFDAELFAPSSGLCFSMFILVGLRASREKRGVECGRSDMCKYATAKYMPSP